MKIMNLLVGLIAVLALVQPLFAQPEPEAKKQSYIVVEKTKGNFEIMQAEELKDYKKKVDEEYKSDLEAWTKAKAQAKKDKAEFKDPKPEKPLAKKVAGPFKTETEAQEFIKKKAEKEKKKKDKDEPKHDE